jgi:hypothetical protein
VVLNAQGVANLQAGGQDEARRGACLFARGRAETGGGRAGELRDVGRACEAAWQAVHRLPAQRPRQDGDRRMVAARATGLPIAAPVTWREVEKAIAPDSVVNGFGSAPNIFQSRHKRRSVEGQEHECCQRAKYKKMTGIPAICHPTQPLRVRSVIGFLEFGDALGAQRRLCLM